VRVGKEKTMKAKTTALAALAVVAAIAGTATRARADEEAARGRLAIVGSWTETPMSGPSFLTLNSYGADGVLISSAQGPTITAGPFASSFTPAQGQWIYRGGRTFSTTAVTLGSDLTDGHLLFVLRIRSTVTVDASGNAYHAVGRTEAFDGAGTLLFAFDSASEGHRINVEPLN
jgi:hypothetical protein